MTDRAPLRVMIVEDEALVALTLEDLLVGAGHDVCHVADRPSTALAFARVNPLDLAVVDVRLAEGGDGIALAASLALLGPMLILFATGNPAEVRARATAGHGCLGKPFEDEWLLSALDVLRTGVTRQVPSFFTLPVA